jgi:cell division septum initiation protein DivIVA
MTRPAHTERKAARKAAKKFLRSLTPAARVAYYALEVGDEAVVFMPSGEMAHMLREDERRFRVRELEDEDAAVDVGMRWAREDRAAGAVQ